MPNDRDVRAFDERAATYESGVLGQLHRDISVQVAGRRGKARTRARATRLVTAAGLHSPRWHRVHAVIIQAVTAVK